MLSTTDTRSTGISVLLTSMFVYGRINEGSAAQSTSTRLYTLQRLSPIDTVSSSALKFVIDTVRSLKFMAK